jgi:hypothetical protein
MVLVGGHDLAVLVDCTDLTELDRAVRQVRCIDRRGESSPRSCRVPSPARRQPQECRAGAS